MTGAAEGFEIDLGDVRLAAVRQGAGDPVLFVHGSASDKRIWAAQLPVAAERFEAIAYCRRWHLPNPPITAAETYAMAAHADDLEAVIDRLERGPVHLVAHSYGAVVALAVAARRPDLVRSLIAVEPPAFTLFTSDPPQPLEMLRLVLRWPALGLALARFGATAIAPATRAARDGDLDGILDAFGPGVLGPCAFAALTPETLRMIRDNLIAEEFTRPGFLRLDPAALARLDRPAMVVKGAESPRIFQLLAKAVADMLPRGHLLNIPGASHSVQMDRPGPFNAAMIAFHPVPAGSA